MKGQLYRCISPAPEHLWSNKDGSFVGLIREGDIVLDMGEPPKSRGRSTAARAYLKVFFEGRIGWVLHSSIVPLEEPARAKKQKSAP